MPSNVPLPVDLVHAMPDPALVVDAQGMVTLANELAVEVLDPRRVSYELTANGARIAAIAVEVNERTEEIGARRLHTVLERVLDVLSFDASERENETFIVTAEYVKERLNEIVKDQDLSRYIL